MREVMKYKLDGTGSSSGNIKKDPKIKNCDHLPRIYFCHDPEN